MQACAAEPAMRQRCTEGRSCASSAWVCKAPGGCRGAACWLWAPRQMPRFADCPLSMPSVMRGPSCVRPACPMRALYAFEVEIARVGCPVLHLGIADIASPGLQVSAKYCMIFLTEWRQLFHRSCFHAS